MILISQNLLLSTKMKRFFFCLTLVAGLFLAISSCHRDKEDPSMAQFAELAQKYVAEELQIEGLDSVRVVKVDTVDSYEYAQIIVDLLHQMDAEMLYQYQAALLSGDTTVARDLEIQIDEIAAAGEQWDMEVAATEGAPKTFRFYLLTANYYAGSEMDQFYFFVTPDFKVHIPDPFEEL